MSLCEDSANGLEEAVQNRRTYSTGAYAKDTLLRNLERRLSIQSISRRFSKDSNAPIDTGLRYETSKNVRFWGRNSFLFISSTGHLRPMLYNFLRP